MNKKLPLLLFFVATATTLFAQSDSIISRNIKALDNYATAKPIEKVHLHLDRQLYFPGDTIWFKAYLVIGEYHKLSALSGILYAELIDPKDSVIKRLNLSVQAGTAPGDFELPFDIAPGTYRVRAYTTWMRNFGSEYFFDQPITIAGFSTGIVPTQTNIVKVAVPSTPNKVDIQFFPEGGELVNGLRSKVAFKAISENGMAEDVQGSILDNSGNEVATFTSQHLGMGVFPLEPQKGKLYFAKLTASDGSTFSVPLPVAKEAGFTLSINKNLGDSLYVKIAAINVPDTAFYLMAQSGGKNYFAAARKLANKVYTAFLLKSRFPTGIAQFTLFSQSGEPLNERIVFIQNNDPLKLSITLDKNSYAPSEKVKLALQAKEPNGASATGTFSISVIDESRVPVNEQAENTIFTDLLLKSEISGYIEDPNYYFIDPSEKNKADLDLLMLTQGYRRFEWKEILSNRQPIFGDQPEKGFGLSGTVKTSAGKLVAKGVVILTSVKNRLVLDTLTDDNGRFRFENIGLTDTATIIINSKKANGNDNVVLEIDKPSYPVVTKINSEGSSYVAAPVALTGQQTRLAYTVWRRDSLGHVIQLKEVIIKEHKIPPFHPDYSQVLKYSANLNGPGNANQVLMAGDDFQKYPSLADALYGKVHGVEIGYRPPGRKAYSTRAKMRHLIGPVKPMAIYLNGTQVPPDYLDLINPADVYSVEVLTSAMYLNLYGTDATNGALIVTLKNGSEISNQVEIAPGLLRYNFRGFYKAREFYTSNYAVKQSVGTPVNRTTVFWNSKVQCYEDKEGQCEYYNSNAMGIYAIIVEGISDHGTLVHEILKYQVK